MRLLRPQSWSARESEKRVSVWCGGIGRNVGQEVKEVYIACGELFLSRGIFRIGVPGGACARGSCFSGVGQRKIFISRWRFGCISENVREVDQDEP